MASLLYNNRVSGEFYPPFEESQSTPAGFDIHDYLSTRDTRDNFVLVELGHNDKPIAKNQRNLTAGRAYIGIEAWLRDRKHTHYLRHLGDSALKNSFFIDQYLYPEMEHNADRTSHDSDIHTEAYDPRTILPDNAADELFLSNVFGDPHIHADPERPRLLLQEAKRLLTPGGTLVIRETLTPYFSIREEELADSGLSIVYRENHGSNKFRWAALEDIYNGGNSWAWVEPTSFYLFIQHTDQPTDSAP